MLRSRLQTLGDAPGAVDEHGRRVRLAKFARRGAEKAESWTRRRGASVDIAMRLGREGRSDVNADNGEKSQQERADAHATYDHAKNEGEHRRQGMVTDYFSHHAE